MHGALFVYHGAMYGELPPQYQSLLNEFLAYLRVEKGSPQNTFDSYGRDLHYYLSYLHSQGLNNLETLSSSDLEKFVIHLSKIGYAGATIDRFVSSISSFHKFLVKEGLSSHSPASKLPKRARLKTLPRVLSVDEVDAIIDQFAESSVTNDVRDRAILEVLYSGGLRASELCDLSVLDYAVDESYLRVIGKGSKERIAPIGEHARVALAQYLDTVRPVYYAKGKQKSGALFLSSRGAALSRIALHRIVKAAGDRAGIADVHPHLFRHSYATHMLEGGADLRSLQELLGHADLSTTQIYTHVEQSYLRSEYLAKHPRARKR